MLFFLLIIIMVIKLKLFDYFKKIFIFIFIITIIAILIHVFICLDIKNFKISVSHITRNYNLFKALYPIIYILLGISVYRYSIAFDTSKNIYIVGTLYLIMIALTLFSSVLSLRYAKFIYSFWCIIASGLLDSILSYILYTTSSKFLYISGMHVALYSYLSVVTFWLYYQSI